MHKGAEVIGQGGGDSEYEGGNDEWSRGGGGGVELSTCACLAL